MTELRERISSIQRELSTGALTPDMARENLIQLTALWGNVVDAKRHADHEYKLVLLGCMQGKKAANRARIEAECTPQYQALAELEDLADLVIEMIRSLKEFIRSLNEELRMTPRQ